MTTLLSRLRDGDTGAREELVRVLYDEFRRRARTQRMREGRPQSFETTDLTHDALLRLMSNDELVRAADGHQVFRAFVRAVRQCLVDRARRRDALRRGGGRPHEDPDGWDELSDSACRGSNTDLLTLDEAITRLSRELPREAAVLEMRFFGGYDTAEIAAALEISVRTVERDSRFALAWLRGFLSREGVGDGPP